VKNVRLLERSDTSLAVALIASALVIFQRPMRFLLDFAQTAEAEYGIDLLPGLIVLVGAFAFHQYRKRQQAKATATAAAADAAQERARSEELERLVALGRALGGATEPQALRQILWRNLPPFAQDREIWLLSRTGDRWDRFLHDATTTRARDVEVLEGVANRALSLRPDNDPRGEGFEIDDDVCFPMLVGESVVGMIGVRNEPPLSPARRRGFGAAVALVAIAMRNLQSLHATREHGLRDSLTGCYNRRHGLEHLDREIRRARRTRLPLSLFMFDLDHFKDINDQYGHLTGDAILAGVGRLLAQTLRVTDVKCRYGGDEFLVILPETPMIGARQAAEGFLKELANLRVPAGDTQVSVGASLGLISAEPGDSDPVALIARADEALYRAKRAGRNQLAIGAA
jgi:diguanylate cyclase (GGDEF)-like protein